MRGAASRSGAVQIAVSMIGIAILLVDIGDCNRGVSHVWCNAMGGAPLSVAPVDSIDWSVHFLVDASGCELLQGVYVDCLSDGAFGRAASAGGEGQRYKGDDCKVE